MANWLQCKAFRRSGISVLALVLSAAALSAPATATEDADSYVDALAEAAPTPALHWSDCEDGFQCTTARVPLDYNQPNGDQIDLAVIKLPAADPSLRIGTLFINFGGPGPSGVDRMRERARWEWLFSDELRSQFDLLAWDSRSVARSSAMRCFANADEQLTFLSSMPEMPMDTRSEAEYFTRAKDLADRCERNAGPILHHASTANTARDLDLLRRAVGDSRLTYHGISYGTQLGAIYANMFPNRVRAMVFDGSMDFQGNINGYDEQGTTVPLDVRQNVAVSIAETFDEFLRQCAAAGQRCAFGAGDPRLKWTVLTERARIAPIRLADQTWTYSAIVGAASSLARPSAYPDLAVLLQRLFDTATTFPPLNGLRSIAEASYMGNRTEAYYAIQCSDSAVPTDPSVYSRAAITEEQRVPHFGRIGVFSTTVCAFWRGHDTDRYTGPWNRSTSAPILVLNSRFDPATPLSGAIAGAAALANAQVVVIEGAGHSSMYVASTCAEQVKRDYLVSGKLPPADTKCAIDMAPFG